MATSVRAKVTLTVQALEEIEPTFVTVVWVYDNDDISDAIETAKKWLIESMMNNSLEHARRGAVKR